MKRLVYLFIAVVVALSIMPVAAPTMAQADAVKARVMEYGKALPKGYGVTKVDDVVALLAEKKPLVLLDVRETTEYAEGHIENSLNVPLRTLAKNLNLLPDLKADILVICKGGFRAIMAQAALNILGYSNVKTLQGGYDAWVGEDLPVVKEATTPDAATAPEINAEVLTAVDSVLSNLPKNWDGVAPKDLAAEIADKAPILIDVRSKEEWDKGYIEGAQHIWINEFVDNLDKLPADKSAKVVVYCQSSYRGGIVKIMMNLLGYSNVRNMSGGVNAWVKSELPLVGAAAPAFNLDESLAAYLKSLPETFNAVRVDALAEELKGDAKPFLLDVRTAEEFAEGHIEGAINVPLNEVTKNLALLPDLNQNIVVYCGSGHRSAVAMTALGVLGYTKTRSMLSGFGAWTAAGQPATTDVVDYKGGTAPAVNAELLKLVDAFMNGIPAGYYTVKAADLNTALAEKAPFLLDVRTDGEWANGRIQGAVHVPLADLLARMSELPTDKAAPMVVYDNPTHRSSMALVFLRLKGYTDVKVLGGGTGAWEKAKLPLVK